MVALEVSAGAGPIGGGVVDGDAVEVSGGRTDCTFGLSWEESNGVSEIVGSANGGELMLEEPKQQNHRIFQLLLLMEELTLKEADQQMG